MRFCFTVVLILVFSVLNAQALPENPEHYFDFWVGEWSASWDEGDGQRGYGTNHITKTLDGIVIHENFEIIAGKSKGFKGTSISVYETKTKKWKQAWADNQHGFLYFTGKFEGDKRIFQTEISKDEAGNQNTQRMVFYAIRPDAMTWDWESSKDGGKTWTLNWRIDYLRKE